MNESVLQESGSVESLVSRVADEYFQRLDQGEQPQIEEYAERHPEIAAVLRHVLPALELLRGPGRDVNSAEGMPALLPPAIGFLGDYRLCREVGRGGMGVVYEAEQISLGRRVALKVLPLAAALDGKQLQRFKLEAQAAAHLHHTNIVPVFAVGCERGVHYYAMQYIEGRSLADVIAALRAAEPGRLRQNDSDHVAASLRDARPSTREPLSTAMAARLGETRPHGSHPELPAADRRSTTVAAALTTRHSIRTPDFMNTAARMGAQAAEALEYAHQMGVVHRDIKPANLLADARGNLLVTDFGLARFHGSTALTMTGDMLGTLRYMSPEQALAKHVALDHRTDIYSLGATLYELLTLEPAFGGRDREEILRQIAFDEPKPLRQINPSIPAELEIIVNKAMAKSADERYATAQDLADDLERFRKDEPIRARRPSLFQRTRRWVRRHQPVVWSAGVSVTLLLVAALVGLTISNVLISRERQRTLQENRKVQLAESAAKRRLFDARLAQARGWRWSKQVGQRFESWKAITEAAQLTDELKLDESRRMELRDEAIACLALADLRLVREWQGYPPGSTGSIAFDRNFQRYARSDLHGNISVREVADDRELICLPNLVPEATDPDTFPINRGASVMRFSLNGEFLAAKYWLCFPGTSCNFRLWNLKSGAPICEPAFAVDGFDFSPDGRYLALGQKDKDVLIMRELATGSDRQCDVGRPVEHLAFNFQGTQVAVANYRRHDVEVRDATSGKLACILNETVGITGLAWHKDGILLAAGGDDNNVHLWDVITGKKRTTLHGHQNTVVGVYFTPGGELLHSCAWDGTTRLWDPWTGHELLSFPGTGGSFSQDGRWLASRGGWSVALRELAPERVYRTLRSGAGKTHNGFLQGNISPDGRWLVTASADGIGLWDLKIGKESCLLASSSYDVQFDPSGDSLLVCGPSGLYRWSIQSGEDGLQLDQPHAEKLLVPGAARRLSLNQDGTMLAVLDVNGARILTLEQPAVPPERLGHLNAATVALSPDGKWVATGTHNGFGVHIWEARSSGFERELMHDERMATVLFSPDSAYLVTGTVTEFSFWDVKNWQLVRQIPREHGVETAGDMVFSPDGKLLAISLSPCVVQLIDSETGRPLARLQPPDTDQIHLLGFNRDSSQLVVSTAAGSVRVWELGQIRAQLRELGLDWSETANQTRVASGGN